MHAGKRPCGPFRCDGVTEMQVEEGLDALENAARHDSSARAARQILGKGSIDQYRKGAARSPQLDHIHIS
jgi:hypothetical protein